MKKKIGVMLIGINGAIGTTLTSGTIAINKDIVQPNGLVTNLEQFLDLDLIDLDSLVFGGWDLRTQSHCEWVIKNNIISSNLFEEVKDELQKIEVFKAPTEGVSKGILSLNGVDSDRSTKDKSKIVESLVQDINIFKKNNNLDGVIVVNISSTEPLVNLTKIHENIKSFEVGIKENNQNITPGMLYAYVSLLTDSPYINFTPNLSFDIPALLEFANIRNIPLAGKDGKTGQTLYKTVLAPMFKRRNLKVEGWYSTNILGNSDGKVLEDPIQGATKIKTKSEVLHNILGYDDTAHDVHIHYYPPRGDKKEAWDNIDFKGWLDIPMTMKIDWLGQDSALAAPLVIDLVRLIWLSYENSNSGVIEHLSSFFKAPIGEKTHDFFEQFDRLYELCDKVKNK